MTLRPFISFFFFFNDTATTEIYTLSLHDALPIYAAAGADNGRAPSPDRRHALHRPASTVRMPDAGRVRAAGATARHQPLRCADARAQAQRRQVFRNRGRPGAGLALCRPRIYSNRNPGVDLMLSFNNIYGQPAALMRRRIWSGEERKISGVSAHIANAFKPVRSVSPANFSASMGLYNGRLYFLAKGGNVYTTQIGRAHV